MSTNQTIVFQKAGEFTNLNEKIYYSDKFALYFYKIPLQESDVIITNSFEYITEEEYTARKLSGGQEFILYENCPNLKEESYDLSITNVSIPVEAIEECIEKFTDVFTNATTMAKNVEDMKRLNIIDEEVSNIIV